ncbi:hypothetical protein ACP70R_033642 [Stipagrostis hirtigluma subsp. patula]
MSWHGSLLRLAIVGVVLLSVGARRPFSDGEPDLESSPNKIFCYPIPPPSLSKAAEVVLLIWPAPVAPPYAAPPHAPSASVLEAEAPASTPLALTPHDDDDPTPSVERSAPTNDVVIRPAFASVNINLGPFDEPYRGKASGAQLQHHTTGRTHRLPPPPLQKLIAAS